MRTPNLHQLLIIVAICLTPLTGQQAIAVARQDAPDAVPVTFDHVIVISIDGIRSDALLVDPPPHPTINLIMSGSSTLNARTDPDHAMTLPNHTSMFTGRHMAGEHGHAWTVNEVDRKHHNLHDNRGEYVASLFDVANEHGVRTGLFASKGKFLLYRFSYSSHDAEDSETAANAADRPEEDDDPVIDAFFLANLMQRRSHTSDAAVTDALLAELSTPRDKSLYVIHYRDPDTIGHTSGWDLTKDSPYLRAIAKVDQQLARLVAKVRREDHLRGRTAIILTTDHGGGSPFKTHTRADMWVNYIIPFAAWTGDGMPHADLYELNEGVRFDPGLTQPPNDSTTPPIRNGDAANLALDLLGLPAIPGSTINAKQDLEWKAAGRS